MKEKKIGVFTLAITLILLGALFLINNFIKIDIYFILSIFWPSIIILLGLEIVLSKVILERDETKVKLSISGKSVFFILMIVSVVFVFSVLQKFPLYIDIDGGIIPISYKSETIVNKDITVETKEKSKLKIINSYGYVNVNKGNDKDIKVNMFVKMKHNYDEEEAKKIADDILKVIDDSGDSIRLINQRDKYTPTNDIKDIEVNLDITIPYDMELDITNKHGDINLYDCGKSATITNAHGSVLAQSLKGALNIENSHGDIEVLDIDGKVTIQNRHGKISANKISKDISIINDHGKVKASDIEGNLEINSSHDGIEVEKIGGNLNIESKYCRVDINDVTGDINVNGKHGIIGAKNIEGNVRINNEHGAIKVWQANKSIELKNRNSEIVFESNEVISEELEIENEHGRIDIRLPQSQEGKFNIYTRHGKINNDFGLKVTTTNNEESIDESIGAKDVKINIRAENGNIEVDAATE